MSTQALSFVLRYVNSKNGNSTGAPPQPWIVVEANAITESSVPITNHQYS